MNSNFLIIILQPGDDRPTQQFHYHFLYVIAARAQMQTSRIMIFMFTKFYLVFNLLVDFYRKCGVSLLLILARFES